MKIKVIYGILLLALVVSVSLNIHLTFKIKNTCFINRDCDENQQYHESPDGNWILYLQANPGPSATTITNIYLLNPNVVEREGEFIRKKELSKSHLIYSRPEFTDPNTAIVSWFDGFVEIKDSASDSKLEIYYRDLDIVHQSSIDSLRAEPPVP